MAEEEAVSAEAVLRELGVFELSCQGEDVPARLVELCLTHGLGPVTLANELLAFVTSKDLGTQLSAHGLDAFEHEVLAKRGGRVPQKRDNRYSGLYDIRSLPELLDEEEEDELLDAYTTPSKGSQKRSNSTPENPRPKRTLSSRSPYALFSPNSFSPSVTPSQKYTARGSRGEVVASFGSVQGPSWSGRGGRGCTPKLFGSPEENLTKSYKFMFQKALDVREALSWRIEELGDALRNHHHLEDFASVLLPAQVFFGRPRVGAGDGAGPDRLRQQREAQRQIGGAGGRPRTFLGRTNPPRPLGAEGIFPLPRPGRGAGGDQQHREEDGGLEALRGGAPSLPHADGAGPRAEDGAGGLRALHHLRQHRLRAARRPRRGDLPRPPRRLRPVWAVPGCQARASGELPAPGVLRRGLQALPEDDNRRDEKLVFVPSLRDVHHDYVYPQPPFLYPELPKDDKPRVHFVSDPCTLEVDGVVFGLTSTDLLFHMGAEEISSSSGISDRFTRILKHVLTQRSYYPLYPPSEELNVDYENFYSYASLPVTPDVLVTPSELRYFVKDVLGCVCINPGRLTKGQVGGTYGRLYLQREDTEGERKSPCVAAQVVKI